MQDLSSISVGIRTFLRDEKLFNTIQAVRDTMPETIIVIADCGEFNEEKDGVYGDLTKEGHKVIHLPYDAGFGAMGNAIAGAFDTDYLLIGADDFDFRPSSVRTGIEDMFVVLENSNVDIASGRVRGPYEFNLEDLGDTIIEHKTQIPLNMSDLWYQECDLTVNYSLIKKRVFEKVRWDDDCRIGGGEHGAFFLDVKRAGFKVAYIPGVHISEQEGEDSERYKQYRRRASSPDRPCFVRRGIRKYILGNGKVDYEKKEALDYPEPITR